MNTADPVWRSRAVRRQWTKHWWLYDCVSFGRGRLPPGRPTRPSTQSSMKRSAAQSRWIASEPKIPSLNELPHDDLATNLQTNWIWSEIANLCWEWCCRLTNTHFNTLSKESSIMIQYPNSRLRQKSNHFLLIPRSITPQIYIFFQRSQVTKTDQAKITYLLCFSIGENTILDFRKLKQPKIRLLHIITRNLGQSPTWVRPAP